LGSTYKEIPLPKRLELRGNGQLFHLCGQPDIKGERRLFGWPREWPSRPDDQHFLIEECEWLEDQDRCPIAGVSHMLIPASEVEIIEFLPMATDSDNKA